MAARLLGWYTQQLTQRPVVTNALSAVALFGIGDVAAQAIEHQGAKTTDRFSQYYDLARTARACTFGGLVFSPIISKWWYPYLQSVKSPKGPVQSAIRRVALDQLGFAPFLAVPMYFSVMTVLEGGSATDISNKLRRNYVSTLIANWSVWPAIQFVNFLWVPPHLRILLVNSASIIWNTFLSLQNAGKRSLAHNDA
jgi:hypothetical protein